MITTFTVIVSLCSGLSSGSMLYYCNWALGNSVESGAAKQILVNVIGQAPLGFGVAVLWPLVRKFGKRKVTMIGFGIASLGSLIVLLAGLQAFGYIPPETTGQVIRQTENIRSFFSWCFAGFPMVGYAVCAGIIVFYTVESKMPQIAKNLSVRHQ